MSVLPVLFAALTSAEAIGIMLNSANSVSAASYEEARKLVCREAEAGKPLQQFVIGITTDDKELSKRYLDASRSKILALAEGRDNPLAWYLLSVEDNNLKMLRHAADGGNVQALNALGTISIQQALESNKLSTNNVDNILCISCAYFLKAAQKKDANGFINLGTCYLRGLGCEQDYTLAYRCFMAAAKKGHPEGMDYVSACYENGHGVPKSMSESLKWRMRGRAARGDKAAAEWLKTVQ